VSSTSFVPQVKGDDLAVAGVNANVQLAPSAVLCRAMFFKQPFAGTVQAKVGEMVKVSDISCWQYWQFNRATLAHAY